MSNSINQGKQRFPHLIIHTPHAGTILPIKSGGYMNMGWWVRKNAITPLHQQLTDHYTDKLFSSLDPSIHQISFPYSRLFCDVERLPNDPLKKKGLGICYNVDKFVTKAPHVWFDAWAMSKEQAMSLYHTHHEALAQLIQRSGPYGKLLLDCHSFSERDNILCPNAHEYKYIDICIGFNEDDSKPSDETIEAVADFFRQHGYRVAFNSPFSNSMIARTHVHHYSLMIEVNKHCYMNEDTLEVTAGYYKLHSELQDLYHLLSN